MSSFSLHIATDNAAFDGADMVDEVVRILHRAASKIDLEGAEGTLLDFNGNTVGRYFATDRNQTHDDAAVLDMIEAKIALDGEQVAVGQIVELLRLSGRSK